MSYTITIMAMLLVVAIMALAFVNASPRNIANAIRSLGPLVLAIIGVILFVAGRGGIAAPLLAIAALWWRRNRSVGKIHASGQGRVSTVRSAWLEMELDHETGDLNGVVLTGTREGQVLSQMEDGSIVELYKELRDDQESAALMEAYLDRRMPGWREDSEQYTASGDGGTSGSGPMTKEEAYQILGLDAGATKAEIRDAHRRLMKRVHPDSGGSTFLAARINEAKDILLS